MKTTAILAALFATSGTVTALAQLPPLASANWFTAPSATNAVGYAASLGPAGKNLYYASQAPTVSAEISTWGNVTQSSDLSIPWLAGGGTVKTIFLGESAGELNDFGFIKKGANVNAASSYTALLTDIHHTGDATGNIRSGWESYVNYGAGEALDFWLNNPGNLVTGGTYFSFLENGVGSAFAGGDPYTHVKYTWTNVWTEYLNSSGVTVQGNVNTLLIAFEDWRGAPLNPGSGLPTLPPGDADYTDLVMAFQFLPTQTTPVPEPSTYGIIGTAALLAIAGYRRFKASKAIAS